VRLSERDAKSGGPLTPLLTSSAPALGRVLSFSLPLFPSDAGSDT
jgi:hypothetical protein